MTSTIHDALGAAALLSLAAAACAATAANLPTAPRATVPRTAGPPGDGERRMNVEAPAERLGFDHSLQLRESRTAVPHELRDGDTVKHGDRIQVHVQTSVDAYLYLAYCSKQGLTLYPRRGGVRAPAGVVTAIPTENDELVVDDEPGTEVLYVVASVANLGVDDLRLAAALTAKQPAGVTQDCGPALDALPAPPLTATPAARPAPRQPSPKPLRHMQPVPPDPDFIRHSGQIMWRLSDDTRSPASAPRLPSTLPLTTADSTGIAVARHLFPHIAR